MTVGIFRLLRWALLALTLASCSADPSSATPRFGFGFRRGTSATVTVPPVVGAISYDTSIGLSVDVNGRADLTPRVGASVYYVNSGANGITGSDSNTCLQAQNPSTPKLNIMSAYGCVTDGAGDHVLIAQDASYTRGFGGIGQKGGFSAQYPLVFQSYDATDPTNQAKWGTATGGHRPDINALGADATCCGFIQGAPVKLYRAFRGLQWDGGGLGGVNVNIFSSGSATPDDLLFENDDFNDAQLSVTGLGADAGISPPNVIYLKHLVIRSSTFHGAWASDGHGQGVYWGAVDQFTGEDNVFVRAGWKEGAARTDAASIGGPSGFAHPLYSQDDNINSIVRRSVFIDGPTDSGVLKGGGLYLDNLSLTNPFGAFFGDGNTYSVYSPFGVHGEAARSAFIDDSWGIETQDIRQGASLFHNNAFAFANTTFASRNGLMADDIDDFYRDHATTGGGVSLPSYPVFDRNVLWTWADAVDQSIHANSNHGLIGDIHATWTNNLWGASTSGSNLNNTGATFANAYTESTLLSALGYGSLSAAETAWKANPQLHGWRTGPALVLAGYGVIDPGLIDLLTPAQVTVGLTASGQFIGTHDGTALTFASLPTGFTADTVCRCWHYDGTGTAGSGTFTVTETPATGTAHTTTISWSRGARPVLSSLTATPTSSSVSATISTNTGSGRLFAMVNSAAGPWDWTQVRAGAGAPNAWIDQAISATGSQSIGPISGLTSGNTYYLAVAQLDANNNPSLTSQVTFTATAAWTPASLGAALKVWYDPSDLTTLFQDAAGTTAVTTDGQHVCRINDKSGNGNYLIQTTTAQCPIWHTGSGKSWLTFASASTMSLVSTGGPGPVTFFDGSGQHSAVAAVKFSSFSASGGMVFDADGSPRVSQLLKATSSGQSATIPFSSGGSPFVETGTTITASTATVLMEKTSTSATEIFVNGATDGSTAVTSALITTPSNIAIGYNQAGPAAYLDGNFYGGFLSSGVIGSTDASSAQTYFTGKMFLPLGLLAPVRRRRRSRKGRPSRRVWLRGVPRRSSRGTEWRGRTSVRGQSSLSHLLLTQRRAAREITEVYDAGNTERLAA